MLGRVVRTNRHEEAFSAETTGGLQYRRITLPLVENVGQPLERFQMLEGFFSF